MANKSKSPKSVINSLSAEIAGLKMHLNEFKGDNDAGWTMAELRHTARSIMEKLDTTANDKYGNGRNYNAALKAQMETLQEDMRAIVSDMKGVSDEQDAKEKSKKDNEKLYENIQSSVKTSYGYVKSIANKFSDILGVSISIKSTFNNMLENIKSMLSSSGVGSYNLTGSLFTNSSARETMFKYGLSGGQAYGLTTVKSMLGMSSDEDLMYMNSSQRAVFTKLMNEYDTWYQKMENTGVLENVQEMQLQFAEFKQEFSMQLLEWIGNNKDTILNIMQGTLDIVEGIFNAIGSIIGTNPLTSSSGNSVINNVTVTMTNDITSSTNVAEDIKSTLSDTYRQTIATLLGGNN